MKEEKKLHRPNMSLPIGTYQVICDKCNKIFEKGVGNYAEAAIASMKYDSPCDICGGNVIVETNPPKVENKYSEQCPYPFGRS